MKKHVSILLAAALCLLVGCSNNSPIPDGAESAKTTSKEPASSAVTVKKDQNYNPLTGEYNLKDRAVGKRPMSVMVNNIKKAWPQYGLGSADLCYEVVVEGGITRILAVFSDYQGVPKTGSVRSVRHYFTDLSAPLNTLFVHWGGSKEGYNAIKNRGIDNIDGMTYSKTAFIRDEKLKKSKGQEFSNFLTSETIQKGLNKKKYNTSGKPNPGFQFDEKGGIKGETAATNITVKFSGYVSANFVYDAASNTYSKSEFGKPQTDANTNKQIAVNNVFVLYTDIHKLREDTILMDVDFTGGTGYYFTNGTKIDLLWSKGQYNKPFHFTKKDGSELKVNPGKSWVCIVSDGQKSNTTMK